jgi:hypothetical protein
VRDGVECCEADSLENVKNLATKFKAIWAGDIKKSNVFLSAAMHYGNESTLELYYGNVCILTHW